MKTFLQIIGVVLILMLAACASTDPHSNMKDGSAKEKALGRPSHPSRGLTPTQQSRGPGWTW